MAIKAEGVTNRLCCGDKLGILREHFADARINLVCLDCIGFQKAKRETRSSDQGKLDL